MAPSERSRPKMAPGAFSSILEPPRTPPSPSWRPDLREVLISQVRFNAAFNLLHPFPSFRLGLVTADRFELVFQVPGNVYDVGDFVIRDRSHFSVCHAARLRGGDPICEQTQRLGSLLDRLQALARNGSVIGVTRDAGRMKADDCIRKEVLDLVPDNGEALHHRQLCEFPVGKMIDVEA